MDFYGQGGVEAGRSPSASGGLVLDKTLRWRYYYTANFGTFPMDDTGISHSVNHSA